MHQPGEAPNPVDIELFLDALYENAIAIPSSSTPLGHLALVVEAAKFLALNNGEIWDEPRNPGTAPTAPTNVATAQAAEQVFNPEIALFTAQERIRIYNESKSTYKTFLAAKTALRNQVLNAVDDKFISALKESIVSYTRLAPLDIISHLKKEYGEITESDLTNNDTKMQEPWDPSTPIEDLYERLEKGQRYARAAGEDIADATIVRYGYTAISATGLFATACEAWTNKARLTKTWTLFKTTFKKANDHRGLSNPTAAEMGVANSAETIRELEDIVQLMMAAKEEDIKPPRNPEPEPVHAQNAVFTNDQFQTMLNFFKNNTTNTCTQIPAATTTTPPNNQQWEGLDSKGFPIAYCWTHGISRNLKHNSHTCTRRREGHKEQATLHNRMGGSNNVLQEKRQSSKGGDTNNANKVNATSPYLYPGTPKLIADTGCSVNSCDQNCSIPLKNIQHKPNGTQVLLPDSSTMRSTHIGILDLSKLLDAAKQAHIFSHLAFGSLLSVGQLCDHNCGTVHQKKNVHHAPEGSYFDRNKIKHNKSNVTSGSSSNKPDSTH